MKRKTVLCLFLIFFILLSACHTEPEPPESSHAASSQIHGESSAAESASPPVEEPPVLPVPEFTLLSDSAIQLTGDLSAVETIRVFFCHVSSENEGVVMKRLVLETTPAALTQTESGAVLSYDLDQTLEETTDYKDNREIKIGYASHGIQVCYSNGDGEKWSDYKALETTLETGVVNQYDATLRGDTACGAANGVLLLQSVLPVWGEALTLRLNEIRNYSALSFDYSWRDDADYCLSGEMIANSVNKYLSDHQIEGYAIQDFGDSDRSEEEILIGLIDTGRAGTLQVAYSGGEILTEFRQFTHWILINGYRFREGRYEFRWANTLNGEERWVTSDDLKKSSDAAVYDNNFGPLYYPDGSEYVMTRCIEALRDPLVDSLI